MDNTFPSANNSDSDDNKFVIVDKSNIPDQVTAGREEDHVSPSTSTCPTDKQEEGQSKTAKRGNSSTETSKPKRRRRDKIHLGTPWDPFSEAVCTTLHYFVIISSVA